MVMSLLRINFKTFLLLAVAVIYGFFVRLIADQKIGVFIGTILTLRQHYKLFGVNIKTQESRKSAYNKMCVYYQLNPSLRATALEF